MKRRRTIDRAARKATRLRRKPLREDQANAARVRLHAVLEMLTRIELEPAILAQAASLAHWARSTRCIWRRRSPGRTAPVSPLSSPRMIPSSPPPQRTTDFVWSADTAPELGKHDLLLEAPQRGGHD